MPRRQALLAASTAAVLPGCAATTSREAGAERRHYVLVHGAWHGAWVWHRLAPLLRQAGHNVTTPTLSGLGERAHHAPGRCGLDVHVKDIAHHLVMEDLQRVVLVGHSYAGCVVSGVLAALSFVQSVQGDPFADSAVRLSYLKCAQNPNPGFKNAAAAVQRDPRFRYAEVDGHHNVMLIHPERLAEALMRLG